MAQHHTPESGTVHPPRIVWPDEALRASAPPRLAAMRCPNCDAVAPKTLVLAVDFISPGCPLRRRYVLACPDCGARFFDVQRPPDYAEAAMLGMGRVPFYVQQGAGLGPILRPLAMLPHPAGSAYMEVGCGYGFGLDFAIRARGWRGRGIDPAGLSALGRDQLGLPIALRYLREDDEAAGTLDIVLGSEVIEHVPSPSAFLRTLRAMLRPDGVLVLTTPDGGQIRPETSPGALVPLLSPGLHLVLQTASSLERLLREAGFAEIIVETDSHSLLAFASDAPIALDRDAAGLRARYRAHLLTRAAALPADGDPFLAFAGRALQECVNDADWEGADRAWALLLPAVRARFGLDLAAPTSLAAGAGSWTLEEMAGWMPLALGGILLARSIRRIAAGTPRPELESAFTLAADAAARLRRALGALAMEDGQTEEIGWAAQAEALLCAAAAGREELPSRLAALPPAPTDGAARRHAVAARALSGAVNAGHMTLGRALAASEALDGPDTRAAQTAAGRDTLFALAVLDLQPGGDPGRARERFARVRESAARAQPEAAIPPPDALFWAAMRGEVEAATRLGDPEAAEPAFQAATAAALGNDAAIPADLRDARARLARARFVALVNAGQYAAARTLVGRLPPERQRGGPPDAATRDVCFALGVLAVQAEPVDPALAATRFARAREGLEPEAPLFWAALRGEILALEKAQRPEAASGLAAGVMQAVPPGTVPPDLRDRFSQRPAASAPATPGG